jgi:PAP2 superfamily
MEGVQSLANIPRRNRITLRADLVLIALFGIAMLPAFIVARLPFRIDLDTFVSAYWGGTAAQAIFVAVILSVAGLSLQCTLVPMWRSFCQEKLRFLGLILLGIWMVWLFGPWLGLIIVVNALAFAELLERRKQQFGAALLDIFVPSAYLFVGVLGVYLLNHAIAGIKFAATYDQAFNRADVFLFGTTASAVSYWMVTHLPKPFFSLMEFVYRTLYAQIGAAIVITALLAGREYAMRYVRTLLVAYCLALMLFFLWPTIGPFAIRDSPASDHTSFSSTYWMQETIVLKARLLWAHTLTPAVRTVDLADYYVGFPSMHVAMPLIAIWFLRKRREIAFILLALDAVMLLSIIALEWHYFVDLFGGVLVAALAAFITKERRPLVQTSAETNFRDDEIGIEAAVG